MAKIPGIIGKYKILGVLGTGGSSIVYLAFHPTLKRKVVLKKLNLRGKKAFYDRFLQEAALMMDLNHEHILRVYDHFKEGSRHYMVMEYVEGASLDRILEVQERLTPGTARFVLECCCRALAYIHDQGIVHRDIKPSNIFISSAGDVKLGDFGIASLEAEDEMEHAGGQGLLGTPAYMAPEQFSGTGKTGPHTDLYALGVTFFELLQGTPLFQGPDLEALRQAVLRGRHASLGPVLRQTGFLNYYVIRRCIAPFSRLRYSSAHRLLKLLRFSGTDPLSAREDLIRCSRAWAAVAKKGGGKGGKTTLRNKRGTPPPHGFHSILESSKSRRRYRAGIGMMGLGVLFFLFLGWALADGAFFRWFFPESYGVLVLELESGEAEGGRKDTSRMGTIRKKTGKETFPDVFNVQEAALYREDSSTLHLVSDNPSRLFSGKGRCEKAGLYRLNILWGHQVYWQSFYLPALAQKPDGLRLRLQPPPLQLEPVHLRLNLFDALSGEGLSAGEGVYIFADEHWRPLTDEAFLLTGQEYFLKFQISGYEEQFYHIPVRFYQNDLLLDVGLFPRSGRLAVNHNVEGLVLKVNGSSSLSGQRGGMLRFGVLEEKEVWDMEPGVYRLGWMGKDWTKMQKLTVRSGERVEITIRGDVRGKPDFRMNRIPLEGKE